jgi:hypothetical protein
VEWKLKRAYKGPVPLNAKKVKYLGRLMCYIPQCYMPIYEEIFLLPAQIEAEALKPLVQVMLEKRKFIGL